MKNETPFSPLPPGKHVTTAEESVTLDNGGFTALELNSRTLNSKNSFLKKNGTRCAVKHKHTHTFLAFFFFFFKYLRYLLFVCVCPGLPPGPAQVVFTTLTRTSVTTITEPYSPRAPLSLRSPLRSLSQRYLSLSLFVSLFTVSLSNSKALLARKKTCF